MSDREACVKIVSDGSPAGTRVLAMPGEVPLDGAVVAINWSIGVDQIGTAEVTLGYFPVEVEGRLAVKMRHPVTGELKTVSQIGFSDGEAWEPDQVAG